VKGGVEQRKYSVYSTENHYGESVLTIYTSECVCVCVYVCACVRVCACKSERKTVRARQKVETGGIGHNEFKSALCFCVDIKDEL